MVSIRYGELHIGRVRHSSGVFTGSNALSHFKSTVKRNQAFGTVSGEGTLVSDGLSWLKDRDQIDTATQVRNRE